MVISRAANALFEVGEVGTEAPQKPPRLVPLPRLSSIVNSAIGAKIEKDGGLWVGGRATLTSDDIRFEPNAMNRHMHSGIPSVSIPLASIEAITVKRGILTNIVELRLADQTFCLRCFKARAFACDIEKARATARRHGANQLSDVTPPSS